MKIITWRDNDVFYVRNENNEKYLLGARMMLFTLELIIMKMFNGVDNDAF
jgi:hypothetical protein